LKLTYFIATLFKSGESKKAPGTIGSLVSLLIWAPLVLLNTPGFFRIFLAAFIFFVGFWAIQKSLHLFKNQGEDPQSIVIDEAAGLGFALSLCSGTWLNVIIGFAMFRFFDILKPWPINCADRQIPGPFGIMFDDFLAGAYTCFGLYIIDLWLLPLLGI